LLAKNSGGGPFDECLSGVWWRVADTLAKSANNSPLPQACCSTTIELRGELDVSHALAQSDAQGIFAFLQHVGALACAEPPDTPALKCQPTPLAGSQTLTSAVAGVVVFAAPLGQAMRVGDLVAEVIDPIASHSHRVLAGVDGTFYARIRDRYVTAGEELGKIAGAVPFRTGLLLGA